MTSIHGVIHGRTIELAEDPGIADGQRVQVEVRAAPAAGNWGDGILRSAVMQAIQRQRLNERRPEADAE